MLHSSLTAKIKRIDRLNTTKTCIIVHHSLAILAQLICLFRGYKYNLLEIVKKKGYFINLFTLVWNELGKGIPILKFALGI